MYVSKQTFAAAVLYLVYAARFGCNSYKVNFEYFLTGYIFVFCSMWARQVRVDENSFTEGIKHTVFLSFLSYILCWGELDVSVLPSRDGVEDISLTV